MIIANGVYSLQFSEPTLGNCCAFIPMAEANSRLKDKSYFNAFSMISYLKIFLPLTI